MSRSIYFSRSFDRDDEAVYDAIRGVFESTEIRDEFDLELFDSSQPTGERIAPKIRRDIARAEIVVCLFTRRHELKESEGCYSVPAYVCGEAAFADSIGKKIMLFLEDGVEAKEMGLVQARNYEFFPFERDELDKASVERNIRTFIRNVLAERAKGIPPQKYENYELILSIYPNGYVMSHHKALVRLHRGDPITHSLLPSPDPAVSSKLRLPAAEGLLENAARDPIPYPDRPFAAFASPSRLKVDALPHDRGSRQRDFRLTFAEPGAHRYQWIWGVPHCFYSKREFESWQVRTSGRHVQDVEIMLRVHRQIEGRVQPRLTESTEGHTLFKTPTGASTERDEKLDHLYTRGREAPESHLECTPLFNCYRFPYYNLPSGTDLILIY